MELSPALGRRPAPGTLIRALRRHILLALALTGLLLLALEFVGGVGGNALASFNGNWTYNAVPVLCALSCFAAAVRGADRLVWVCVGLGILSWGLGDIYYTFAFGNASVIPFPSFADAGYLGFYPPVYFAVWLMLRRRVSGFVRSLWLDALIAALTVAALATSIIFQVVLDSLGGASASTAAVATNLAYPLADTLLLAVVFGTVALGGWRFSWQWALFGGGILLFGIADSIYLVRVATNTYTYGTVLDLGWPGAMLLLATASTVKAKTIRAVSLDGRRLLIVPACFATVGLSLEVVDHFLRLNPAAIALASGALAVVIIRMGLTFNDYLAVLAQARQEAVTDALTGLGNRRALLADLAAAVESGDDRQLLLCDLNGFKAYNDRFGHMAGDALLSRLGHRLRVAVEGIGSAYRPGGDEFCVLVRRPEAELEQTVREAVASLTEEGEGFRIAPSVGSVVIPQEAADSSEALKLVDRRMYLDKSGGRATGAEGCGVLVGVLEARDPQLAEHTSLVAKLAHAIGLELGAEHVPLAQLRIVAQLHDIGKVAIPDAILLKPGPLDDEEWKLVRQHTVAGERIVNRVPGFEAVGASIRASHERWDGTGYPDALAGEEIPLMARVIAVADAYEAMTSGDRPYREPRSHAQAVREIVSCAGSQFDPRVVQALLSALARRRLVVPSDAVVDASAA